MSRRVLFIYKDNLFFFSGFFSGFLLYVFTYCPPLPVKLPFPIWGQILPFFSTLGWAPFLCFPHGKAGLCPCSALQECAVLTFPHRREGDPPFLTLGPCFLCRWRCGPRAWQGSPAPSGIYRHIMPSRGHSFFPSHRNTWDPCWPSSITSGDCALHLCDSWFSYSSSGYLYSEKANTWKLFRSAQLVITAVCL